MWELVSQAAQPAIAQYGIKDVDDFITALLSVSYAECGGTDAQGWPIWDTQSVHDNGQGFGCFALHNQGYAGFLTEEQRLDPATNAGAAAMKLAAVWRDGEGLDQNLARMTGPQGQNPADPLALLRNAQAVVRQVAGMMGRAVGGKAVTVAGGQAMAGQETGQGAEAQEVISWWASFFQDEPDYTARQKAEDLFYDDPFKAISTWREMTGQVSGVTEADEALTRAQIANYISLIGEREYLRGRDLILDKMEREKRAHEYPIAEFKAWLDATVEAGRRGETVYGEEMKRKVWTTPEEYYPGTGPRGATAQLYEKYGLEYEPTPGVSVSELPNLEQMYGRWHQGMGISQQAPPLPQTMGAAGHGTGIDAARAFLQRMNLRQGAPQGAAPAY